MDTTLLTELTVALSGVVHIPVVEAGEVQQVQVDLLPGAPGADVVWRAPSDEGLTALVTVALERADAWTGRELVVHGPLRGANAVLGLDLLRVGAPFPADLAVVGEWMPDGSLQPDLGAPVALLVASGRTRLITAPRHAAEVRAAGGTPLVASHLSEALALATGRAWAPPPPLPPLPKAVLAEVRAELRQARERVGPPDSWSLPEPLAEELRDRLREVDGPTAWWASMHAEALPYAWALALRALGPEGDPHDPQVAATFAAAMDSRLERHLRGPADPIPAGRALLGHGLVMERAWAAASPAEQHDPLGHLISLAEAQARAELASLYVTDTMIRHAEALRPHEAQAAARLLARAVHPRDPILAALADRLRAALDDSAWTSVDVALGLGWLLSHSDHEADAARALAEGVAAGLPLDAERLEWAGGTEHAAALALRVRVARLVLRPATAEAAPTAPTPAE